jgi:energy-coupling factor transporter ATP-binding protein EcfA2
MRILDRISRTGTTVVMATHDHAIVDAMQRRVIELDRGRIARDESRGIYETRAPEAASDDPPVADVDEDVPGDQAEKELDEVVEEATEEALTDAIESDRASEEEAATEDSNDVGTGDDDEAGS